MPTDRTLRPASDGAALEARELPASLVIIGAHPQARTGLAATLGPAWSGRVKAALDHLDIPGVIDVEFRPDANQSYGWINTNQSGNLYLGQAQGRAPFGGVVSINLPLAKEYGIDPLRVIVHETTHLLQPSAIPDSGHVADPASIMYPKGIPVAAYASFGVNPQRPYALSDADRATYAPFWRTHTPFVLAGLVVPPTAIAGATIPVAVSARGFTVGTTATTAIVTHPGGTMRVAVPAIGAGESWSGTVNIPATVSGPISVAIEGAASAHGVWPTRSVVVTPGSPQPPPLPQPPPPTPEPPKPPPAPVAPRVSVGVDTPPLSRAGTRYTVTITVTPTSGPLTGGVLVLTTPNGAERVAIPTLATRQRWAHTVTITAPSGTWSVRATVEGAQPTGTQTVTRWVYPVRAASIPTPEPPTRRAWTAEHARVFGVVRNLPMWRTATNQQIAEEVHRRLGT